MKYLVFNKNMWMELKDNEKHKKKLIWRKNKKYAVIDETSDLFETENGCMIEKQLENELFTLEYDDIFMDISKNR